MMTRKPSFPIAIDADARFPLTFSQRRRQLADLESTRAARSAGLRGEAIQIILACACAFTLPFLYFSIWP